MVKVLGLGDNIADVYIHQNKLYPGGNALNFAVYSHMLGADASYMGVFGSDGAARHIIAVLEELGIDISRIRRTEGENAYAMVNIVDGDRVFAGHNNGGVRSKLPLPIEEEFDYLRTFEHIHTSVYSEIDDRLAPLTSAGVPVSYDFSNEWDLAKLDRTAPYIDYALLSCGHLDEDGVERTLMHLDANHPSLLVVATLGSRGSIISYRGHRYSQRPEEIKAVDTLGAGDAYFTAFLLHMLANSPRHAPSPLAIPESMKRGAAFAAEVCLIEGAFGHGMPFKY